MDISETYIKMCEKATEIQNEWDIREGDSHCGKGDTDVLLLVNRPKEKGTDYIIKSFGIWLPRQDQLQGIIGDSCYWKLEYYRSGKRLIDKEPYEITICNSDSIYSLSGKTLEQLWLTFVMKEKYGKIWNGEEWITD